MVCLKVAIVRVRSLRSLFTILLVVGSIGKLVLEEKLIRRNHEVLFHNSSASASASSGQTRGGPASVMGLHDYQQQRQRPKQKQQQQQQQQQQQRAHNAALPTLVGTTDTGTGTDTLSSSSSATNTNSNSYLPQTSNVTVTTTPLAVSSSSIHNKTIDPDLPTWMKDYFHWHYQQRALLNETCHCEHDYKYLVMRCLMRNKKCSGASDRLQSLPTALRLASDSNRLLFIQWERPAPLEEFLVPPANGLLDWRLPVWLDERLHMHNLTVYQDSKNSFDRFDKITQTVVCIKTIHNNQHYTDKLSAGEPSLEQVFRSVWNSMFTPSAPVAAMIQQEMRNLHLVANTYVAAHVRSLYVYNTTNTAEEEHAIDCASQQAKRQRQQLSQLSDTGTWPIYFASDSVATTRLAIAYGNSRSRRRGRDNKTTTNNNDTSNTVVTVVARSSGSHKEPLHLDRGRDFLAPSDDWKNRSAADFYDIFVDLYLLSSARCVAYGAGGYGQLASLLSYNRTCGINHRTASCEWTD
jgi:hypothetical protein